MTLKKGKFNFMIAAESRRIFLNVARSWRHFEMVGLSQSLQRRFLKVVNRIKQNFDFNTS